MTDGLSLPASSTRPCENVLSTMITPPLRTRGTSSVQYFGYESLSASMNATSNASSSGQRAQRVERRAEAQLDPVGEPGLLPVLARDRRPLLADVAAQQPPAGAEPAGDADGRVAGEGAHLDPGTGAAEPGEQRQQRAHLGRHLKGDLTGETLRRLGGQLPQHRVRRGAVRRQVRVQVEADLLAAPRHGNKLSSARGSSSRGRPPERARIVKLCDDSAPGSPRNRPV